MVYLWLEVRSKLRHDLDSIVTPLGITVLHVRVAFVAGAGAGVLHIGTCGSPGNRTCLSSKIYNAFSLMVPNTAKLTNA